MFMPEEDRYTYAEGLRRGGYLLSVNVTDARYEEALDILDDEGTINIDERAETWRKEGWTGLDKSTTEFSQGTRGNPSSGQSTSRKQVARPKARKPFRLWKSNFGSASAMSAAGEFVSEAM